MPASEPLPGTPTSIWVGPDEARAFWGAVGMDWVAPIAAIANTRIVDIAALCAGPQPIVPDFTTADVLAVVSLQQSPEATRAKIDSFVDASLWPNYCHYVDDSPPPPPPFQDRPPDFPPGDPPIPDALARDTNAMMQQVWSWVNWLRKEIPTRHFLVGPTINCTGTGQDEFPTQYPDGATYPVSPVGFQIDVTIADDLYSKTMDGDPPLYWDIGNLSWGMDSYANSPIKVMHQHQLVYPVWPEGRYITWNLRPGVSLVVTALYATQAVTPHIE